MAFFSFVRQHARPLAFGALHSFYSAPGQTFCIGLFIAVIGRDLAISPAEIGGLYFAATLGAAVTLLFVGQWIDHVRLIHFSAAVVTGLAIACFVMATAIGPLTVLLGFYALRLTGQGLMIHVEATATARAFEAERGRALGLTALGVPLSEVIFPPLAIAGIAALGWRPTYALFGAVALVCLLPLTQWLLSGIRRSPPPRGHRGGAWRGLLAGMALLARSRFVWAALPSLAVMPFVTTAVMFYITAIAAAKGWPAGLIAASFPASAIAHVFGLFASGMVIDRVSARRMFPFQSIPIAAAVALLGVVSAPWALPVAFALIGLGGGFMKPVITAVWAELFGLSVLGTIRSAVAMYMVVMSALSPFVFGSLIEAGYAVDAILVAFAIGSAVCLLPSFYAAVRRWT